MNEVKHQRISSFKHTPQAENGNPSSGLKHVSIKKEFEEIYKKSTENLFFAPPIRNIENGYNQKFNIWKSQSGKVNLASKPPKH